MHLQTVMAMRGTYNDPRNDSQYFCYFSNLSRLKSWPVVFYMNSESKARERAREIRKAIFTAELLAKVQIGWESEDLDSIADRMKCHDDLIAQAILQETETLRAENQAMREALENVKKHIEIIIPQPEFRVMSTSWRIISDALARFPKKEET